MFFFKLAIFSLPLSAGLCPNLYGHSTQSVNLHLLCFDLLNPKQSCWFLPKSLKWGVFLADFELVEHDFQIHSILLQQFKGWPGKCWSNLTKLWIWSSCGNSWGNRIYRDSSAWPGRTIHYHLECGREFIIQFTELRISVSSAYPTFIKWLAYMALKEMLSKNNFIKQLKKESDIILLQMNMYLKVKEVSDTFARIIKLLGFNDGIEDRRH